MKIAIVVSKKDGAGIQRATAVANTLRRMGHSIDDSMLHRTLEQEDLSLEKTFKQNMDSIKNADLIIAESSQYSAGLGFLVATAISERKHVLCLHSKDATQRPSGTLRGASSKLLEYVDYDPSEIEAVLKEYIDRIAKELDTKFILIISPSIDKYLKWSSEQRRLHKAQIVRDALEVMMKKDKEYKKFVAEAGF